MQIRSCLVERGTELRHAVGEARTCAVQQIGVDHE